MSVDPTKLRELSSALDELHRRKAENQLANYTPYPKQAEFHKLGATHRERLLCSGNQQGKTFSGAMEMAAHLTGAYPEWWQGRRFSGPVRAWCSGVTTESMRDTGQRLLLGPLGAQGTGAIPKDRIREVRAGRGIPDAVDTVLVDHKSGYPSQLGFKSYERGREKWQGESLDVVWYDEEPPADIYSEGLARIAARSGIVYATWTPLMGMSDVVRRFFSENSPDRALVQMSIEDAKHIAPEERQKIIDGFQEHEREARVHGVPMLGSGRIYGVAESILRAPPIEIPAHWARIVGLDFGWKNFAAVWLAWDRDADIVYVTDCYVSSEQTPIIHAAAIKARGEWIPCAWPHDGLSHEKGSGEALGALYKAQGLKMLDERAQFETGGNDVEAGVMDILDRMRTGRLKVFDHLAPWFEEFRTYHRKDGRIVKEHDHVMDATRYAVMMLRRARTGDSRSRRRTFMAEGMNESVFGSERPEPTVLNRRMARGMDDSVFGS